MAQDIFEFWSHIRKGQKIHPADEPVFRRINAKRHGFHLECLPGSFVGRLRSAHVVLLYLSPGFREMDLKDAKDKEAREYYFEKLKGDTPLRDYPGPNWAKSRTRPFCEWEDAQNKIAILNIGACHSKTFNDYSVLASLPSSRVSLEWAQDILFPEAEAGKRIVICMRAAPYWGLEQGRKYRGTLYAPGVNHAGFLHRNKDNDRLIKLVRTRLSKR